MQDEVGGVFLLFHHPRPQQEAFFVLLLNKTLRNPVFYL